LSGDGGKFRVKLKRYAATVSAIILLLGMAAAMAAGVPGSAEDPVVSLSYMQNTFIPKVMNMISSGVDSAFSGKETAVSARIEEFVRETQKNLSINEDMLKDRVTYSAYMRMLDSGFYMDSGPSSVLTLGRGERAVIGGLSEFSVLGGSAAIEGGVNTYVANVTSGGTITMNTAAVRNSRYVVAEDAFVSVKAVSDNVKILVCGRYQIVPVYKPQYTDMAEVLKSINIFKGTNNGFELEREPTRLEALIIFLRLIGEEQKALEFTGSHPFTDVPKWAGNTADKYVAYAYSKGYTKGMSTTKFGSYEPTALEQYLTFILRALGYKDGTDFVWSESPEKALELGILVKGDKERSLRRGFRRDHAVYISYYSLYQTVKSSGMPLIGTLVQKGLVSDEAAQKTLQAFYR